MKFIKKFSDHSSYSEYTSSGMLYPNVSLCRDGNHIHYNPLVVTSADPTNMHLYKTNMDEFSYQVDWDEYFIYDGTITIEGREYHKWNKVAVDDPDANLVTLLTDTTNFGEVSLENPYEPCGYIYQDSDILYGDREKIVCIKYNNYNANGIEYVDLGLPSGTLWATCNVGSTCPEDAGGYYQWGSSVDMRTGWGKYVYGSYTNYTKYNNIDNKVMLDAHDDVARREMGGDWHMPTHEQLSELCTKTSNSLTSVNGVQGIQYSNNGHSIFIPMAGVKYPMGDEDDSEILLWSSELKNINSANAKCMGIDYIEQYDDPDYYWYELREVAASVRGVLG